uniref:Uncharacterized protein n=1 Tax=Nelumbo nucifera TaxID=4432 RepID=A0A822XNE3_NELNU|nr:TPA_asm: hypothetical protein HUJ06_023025 [Nelumbo nucifera]
METLVPPVLHISSMGFILKFEKQRKIAGFLQLFDRHQVLTGKRLSTKCLPPSQAVDSTM